MLTFSAPFNDCFITKWWPYKYQKDNSRDDNGNKKNLQMWKWIIKCSPNFVRGKNHGRVILLDSIKYANLFVKPKHKLNPLLPHPPKKIIIKPTCFFIIWYTWFYETIQYNTICIYTSYDLWAWLLCIYDTVPLVTTMHLTIIQPTFSLTCGSKLSLN